MKTRFIIELLVVTTKDDIYNIATGIYQQCDEAIAVCYREDSATDDETEDH